MGGHLVMKLPLRRQQQTLLGERQVVKLKDARKTRPKRNRYAKIGAARKDLRAMIRHQSEEQMTKFIRELHARGQPMGFSEVIFPITIIRTTSYRNLVGTKATSARGRKRVIDFAGKKPVMSNDWMYNKPTGTRPQKYRQQLAQREKETQESSGAVRAFGSFNRGEPTTLGGHLAKIQGPYNPGPVDPNYDPEMETTLQQAEARGEYNPWDKEDSDE